MAGESARESARRQRAKAERLQRSAALWEQGADGEAATAEALALLPGESWTVLHDLRWPGRKHANIDHVVVGPPGVFVIDTKNWTGDVAVHDGVLRQNGRARATAVAGAADAAAAVHAVLPGLARSAVFPVLCFVSAEPLSGRSGDVLVCSTANVVELLASRRVSMCPAEARRTAERLADGLASAGASVTAATTRRTPVSTTPSRSPHLREALRLVAFLLIVAMMLAVMKNLDAVTDLVQTLLGEPGNGRG